MNNKMISFSQKISISPLLKSWREPVQLLLSREYAARRGTRDRKQKKKVKAVVEKVGFIPHNLRNREELMKNRPSRKIDDSWQPIATDEIYATKYFQWKVYPFNEAIQCHRETHHPEHYNQPNAPVLAVVELNMQGEKKTKLIEDFNRVCAIKHHFPHYEERPIVAFAKDLQAQQAAKDAGALLTGGAELIKNIQTGKVSLTEFEYVIAHPDILHELSSLRGLLKKKYPSYKLGTIDISLDDLVNKFVHGINYKATKDEFEKDFGIIETAIGTLDMDSQHLEENFASLVNDVMTMKPKRDGGFIRRTLIASPPSSEVFKIDYEKYLTPIEERNNEILEEKEVVDESMIL